MAAKRRSVEIVDNEDAAAFAIATFNDGESFIARGESNVLLVGDVRGARIERVVVASDANIVGYGVTPDGQFAIVGAQFGLESAPCVEWRLLHLASKRWLRSPGNGRPGDVYCPRLAIAGAGGDIVHWLEPSGGGYSTPLPSRLDAWRRFCTLAQNWSFTSAERAAYGSLVTSRAPTPCGRGAGASAQSEAQEFADLNPSETRLSEPHLDAAGDPPQPGDIGVLAETELARPNAPSRAAEADTTTERGDARVEEARSGDVQIGIATRYATDAVAPVTASGEPFDSAAVTVAHATLPLQSLVTIANAANGRSVVARVNDRLPAADNAPILLITDRVAEVLGFSGSSAQVGIRVIGRAPAPGGALSALILGRPVEDARPPWRDESDSQSIFFHVSPGERVMASAAGQVAFAGEFRNYGGLVLVVHGDELVTAYGHLAAFDVEEGDLIESGDSLGRADERGALLFQVRRHANALDALQFFAPHTPN
ncbi:MAG: peptidoglycan DD-metalloendopeptidase family protein [Hyphomonadaceae bacterium JAD_PAG50586_4]|nr:MAG: peptidoglycan DD-metalloendopeptidase family protein [Hyphomonadaceae bacterium JAD_PAG50586_4]